MPRTYSHPPSSPSGALAETLAANYLQQQGLTILARNLRCRLGELDVIAWDGECVVFVEVRLRQQQRYGGAAASITSHKQHRLIQAARYWLAGAGQRWAQRPMRFDCVLLHRLEPPQLEWLKGAFDAY